MTWPPRTIFALALATLLVLLLIAATRDGYRWTVLKIAGPRIAKLKIEPISPPQRSSVHAA